MRPLKPPALAAWLLEHVRFGSTDEALAGDLLEEFQRRQSSGWYWRQVLLAIATGLAGDLRHRKMLTLRAIALSWAVSFLAIVLGRWAMAELVGPRLFAAGLVSLALTFVAGAAGGMLVALMHSDRRNAMLAGCGIALSVWAAAMVVLMKPHARQHPLAQIAAAVLLVYVLVLAGFTVGARLVPRPTL